MRELERQGWSLELRSAILDAMHRYSNVPRLTHLDKALFACDELAGLQPACALVKPTKAIADVEVSSVRKKMKEPVAESSVNVKAGAPGHSVTPTGEEVDDALLVSPPKLAVMLCDPAASVDVEYVATPAAFSMPVPSVVVPSLKVTVPVGACAPDPPVTVAVNVMLEPTTADAAEEASVVVLDPAVTVTAMAVELDAEVAGVATVAGGDGVRAFSQRCSGVKSATPELWSAPVPSVVDPSLKVMVPVGVGVPEVGVTVAVNVTLAPTATEVAEAERSRRCSCNRSDAGTGQVHHLPDCSRRCLQRKASPIPRHGSCSAQISTLTVQVFPAETVAFAHVSVPTMKSILLVPPGVTAVIDQSPFVPESGRRSGSSRCSWCPRSDSRRPSGLGEAENTGPLTGPH